MPRYECKSCGYIYDENDGMEDVGIQKGTAFADIDWDVASCPLCGNDDVEDWEEME